MAHVKALKQNEELDRKYKESLTKNDRLEVECRGYVEKFRRMEETMQNLYREIDEMKLMVRPHNLIVYITELCATTVLYDFFRGISTNFQRKF